ncbi:hypothetical protein L596_000790 [Steinernema carpocapsae]|uniref:Uncharacterized protein n=1 Tax=Steinernema carpocapsae TaxID=34508 RepID=A0A4U8UJT0_STECR|nr:hypothetical protein L596_000790 [Steinernema carpocapsae]
MEFSNFFEICNNLGRDNLFSFRSTCSYAQENVDRNIRDRDLARLKVTMPSKHDDLRHRSKFSNSQLALSFSFRSFSATPSASRHPSWPESATSELNSSGWTLPSAPSLNVFSSRRSCTDSKDKKSHQRKDKAYSPRFLAGQIRLN